MPASSRDMNIPVLVTLGAVSTILVYVIVVATQAWFRFEFNREYERKVLTREDPELIELKAEQYGRLEGGQWVNQEQGVATIPIADATKEAVRMYADRGGQSR